MKVAVTWEMCGYVDIDAETMEEAMEKFNEESKNIEIPTNGEYVDGSFQLSSDNVEEMKAMAGISLYFKEYDYMQMRQIRLGLEKGLDVSFYANAEYDCFQMEEIRLGLEKGLDVSVYANTEYDGLQMQQIRFGLEEGLDVSAYTNPEYRWRQMREIRLSLKEEKDAVNTAEDKEM